MQAFEDLSDLTPKQVVERLDRNIVGQTDAKKAVRRHALVPHRGDGHVHCSLEDTCGAGSHSRGRLPQVANALRNRWRRHKIPSPMKVS